MNLIQNRYSIPHVVIDRKHVNKYNDVLLTITCLDGVLEKSCSRMMLANMSAYFEKVFELETYTLKDGIRNYNLNIPFSIKSVDTSIRMLLFEEKVEQPIEVAFENILTLNYFNIPLEILHHTIAMVISQAEMNVSQELLQEYCSQFYTLLEDYQILSENKNKNLKQRIEYLTEFVTSDSIRFNEGLQVEDQEKKFIYRFSLSNPKLLDESLEYKVVDQYILKPIAKLYSTNIPENHFLIGFSVRPVGEKEQLSFNEAIKAEKKQEKTKNVKINIEIYNGIDDPLIDGKLVSDSYTNKILPNDLSFPTPIQSAMYRREMIGVYYHRDKINCMTCVMIHIEFI